MAIRQALASDLEDLARIVVACSNDDPCYPYRFPLRDQYPLHYAEHCRRKCFEYLNTNTVVVYEVTETLPSGREKEKVVAFSVWDQPRPGRPRAKRSQTWPRWSTLLSAHKTQHSVVAQQPQPCCSQRQTPTAIRPSSRPDHLARTPSLPKPFAREDRSAAFREKSKQAKTDFFDAQYTGGYMFLKLLLCHPDHRRQGAGTALVRWGTAVAHLAGVNTALFSSPMGAPLYRKLGFREIGRFQVAVAGDAERLDIPAMVLAPPVSTPSRRGSCAAEAMTNGLRKCVTHSVIVGKT